MKLILAIIAVEFWWKLEQLSGLLWDIVARGRIECWLDFLPTMTYRKRKRTEHRLAALRGWVYSRVNRS